MSNLAALLRDFAQGASNNAASNVSAPVDALAWLLRKGGVPIPEKPVMGSDWMRQKGLTAEPRNKLAGLLGDAAGFAAPLAAVTKAPQIARGLLNFDEALQPAAARMVENYIDKIGGRNKIFMGESSKTWNTPDAAKAKAMLEAGADPRKVWQETGTWKAPDGMWRQEIDDSAAFLRTPDDMKVLADSYKAKQNEIKDIIKSSKSYPDLFPKELTAAQKQLREEAKALNTPLNENYGLLSTGWNGAKAKYAYPHEELYKAYPDIGEQVVIRQGGSGDDYFGSYLHNQLNVNKSAASTTGGVNSTSAHEMQHAVQGREGFSGGGNTSQFTHISDQYSPELTSLRDKLIELQKRDWNPELGKEITAVNKSLAELMKNPYESYRRLAGEAEARATQARLGLNAAQRRALFPEDSYDVPIKSLIIRGSQ